MEIIVFSLGWRKWIQISIHKVSGQKVRIRVPLLWEEDLSQYEESKCSDLKSQARPRSEILTWPCSSSRMLAGFRSRYTINLHTNVSCVVLYADQGRQLELFTPLWRDGANKHFPILRVVVHTRGINCQLQLL